MRASGMGFSAFYARVPKTIVLENWKLGLLLKTLQATLVVLLVYMVVVEEAWLKAVPQADFQGGLTFWATPSSNADYTKLFEGDLQQDWCVNSKDYNYKYDEYLQYTDYTCIGMPAHERWIRGESELYTPLAFSEKYMLNANFHEVMVPEDCQAALKDNTPCQSGSWKTVPRGMGLVGCECEMTGGNYFVAGASALSLGMELFYKVKSDGEDGPSEGFSSKAKSMENGAELDGLLVVVQDHTGATVEKYEPGSGKPIMISMADVLKHSGAKLDDSMDSTIANQGEGKLKYPLLRMTGVTISAHITYTNTPSDHGTDWKGPVAILSLSHQKIWSRMPTVEHDKPLAQFMQENPNSYQMGQYRFRHYSGVRIKFTTSGIWKRSNFVNFVGHVGQSIPYLYFPVVIVSFLALNCLGPLAKVYKRAGQQRVGLAGHKGHAAVRMVIAGRAYQAIKGCDDMLTKDTLKEEMRQIMHETHLYEEESEHGASFKVTDVEKHMIDRMCEELDTNDDNHITLQEFMQAAIGHDLVGPKELAACEHQSMYLHTMGWLSRFLFHEGSSKMKRGATKEVKEASVVPQP